jgi:hypothetical protein
MFTCSSFAILLYRVWIPGSSRIVAYGHIRTSTKFRHLKLTCQRLTRSYSPVCLAVSSVLGVGAVRLESEQTYFIEHLVSLLSPFRQMSEYYCILVNPFHFTTHFGIRRHHNLNHDLCSCRCGFALTNLRQ